MEWGKEKGAEERKYGRSKRRRMSEEREENRVKENKKKKERVSQRVRMHKPEQIVITSLWRVAAWAE